MVSDPSNALSSWQHNSTNLNFCGWRGVTCGRKHPDRVTSLDLNSLDLGGSLPPHITNLTFLRRLNLSYNSFTGSIPPDLGRLSRLTHLSLRHNSLDGGIPESLTHCSNLKYVSLANNDLSGEIPKHIGSLSYLERLSLAYNNLTGTIPPSFGNISSLVLLLLPYNNLVGGIPHELGSLTLLTSLSLEGNNLDGEIPASLTRCLNLHVIKLDNNDLSGEIPRDIDSLTQLQELSLYYNNLVGSIPASLGNISSLVGLYLAGNLLVGSIPVSIGKLFRLEVLQLDSNKQSGNIPSFLFNLSSMTYMTLSNNSFRGTLPPDMFNTLPNLQTLHLDGNQLEGPIPYSLSNATSMVEIQINSNELTGSIPCNLGNLRHLRHLALDSNGLEAKEHSHWDFLTSLANCSYLEIINIGYNNLGSVLPNSVANLSSTLKHLSMEWNQIGGSIPYGIGNLVNLSILLLENNRFTGSIPDSIGNLQELHWLYMSDNHLTGQVPHTIGHLTQLNILSLQRNNINGSIPASLGNCQNLQFLDLSQNLFTGVIPKELLMISSLSDYLDLSHNLLTGPLPVEVGYLTSLNLLNISDNKLSGVIPSTISNCRSLEYLYMQHNFFDGAIPQSLSGLKGLRELDLSQNNLSGKVADYMSNMGGLEYLNLSYNNLEAEAPGKGIFTNATIVSVLGNKNLCGGSPNLNLPPCHTKIPKEHHRSHVIKVIIPVLGAGLCTLILLLVIFSTRHCLNDKPNKSPSTSFMEGQFKKVSYSELLKATDGFSLSNLIGIGAFGSVYRGTLNFDKSTIVAVKVLNLEHIGASKSFMAECDVLKNTRHRNLVKIITSCSSVDLSGNEFKALVLEFMPNGSLEKWLHPAVPGHHEMMLLNLVERLNIAIDVASALEYLHHHGQTPIVHCDLKPSNILLDADMCAHVGDFGLARLLSDEVPELNEQQTTSFGIKGTIGYVAPEYGMGGQASTYGDIYSYGILLLELFTGRRPTHEIFKDGLSLFSYAEMAFPERVMDIVDSRLQIIENGLETRVNNQNEDIDRLERNKCLVSLIGIGISCSKKEPRERMEMKEIKKELHALKDALLRSQTHAEKKNEN